jgi:hypothetical protein
MRRRGDTSLSVRVSAFPLPASKRMALVYAETMFLQVELRLEEFVVRVYFS